MDVGILALQGAFAEHARVIEKLGHKAIEVRSLADAKKVEAMILPGGESTAILPLLKKTGLDQWLTEKVKKGMPVFGVCAGLILLSGHSLKLIDVDVVRNAYGGQLDSFEDELELHIPRNIKFKGIFIRAPKIKKIGKKVQVLGRHGRTPVLVRQGNVLAASFHPELTDDTRIHEYFLKMG
ncbi:pyridoxal 5'-phosphate synthase glutaminase subunit PdxT [Candidatus Peregrinibacteria bacterium]|nr:pyridoxal 5'-phosphate synthase glutaminase subunit PdxT [Candidatus Peregrinibacteria bacterium]